MEVNQKEEIMVNNLIEDEKKLNTKITMVYKISKYYEKIKVLGEEFIKNNKGNCKLVINKKEFIYVIIFNMKNMM